MKRIALFVTCLVDHMKPNVAWATVRLLQGYGFEVDVPQQSCCGQANYNSGDRDGAKQLALNTLEVFENYDAIVLPSGSCAGMVIKHYEGLFEGTILAQRFAALAQKTYELSAFLDLHKAHAPPFNQQHSSFTYHHSCSCLRELGIEEQPLSLLGHIEGLEHIPLGQSDTCCGFGGTFAAKYGDLSAAIVDKKIDHILETGAKRVVSADLGCLMNIEGRLKKRGEIIECSHIAEVLFDALPAHLKGESS